VAPLPGLRDAGLCDLRQRRALRTVFDEYEELEEEARAEVRSESNPLIAKYVADRLALDVDSDGGKQLKLLAEKLKKLTVEE
jgi:hypothetical protein